jgi:hypothetical protein
MLAPSLQFTGERYPASTVPAPDAAPRTIHAQVEAAVALDQLWPGCLRGRRPVSTCWIARQGRDYVLQVRSAKGPTREFPIGDVPECLWPSEVRNAL